MTTELNISWEGDIPGVANHRLSLAVWLDPLKLFLKSIRRTASRMLADALDDTEYGRGGGRYAQLAERIDLEIAELRPGSLQGTFVVTGEFQPTLFPNGALDWPTRAVERVLNDIEKESSGEMTNGMVRHFLASLPPGLVRQEYALRRNGVEVRTVSVRKPHLRDALPPAPPRLRRLEGSVVAVGFEPPSVTIRTSPKRLWKCVATAEQVDAAIHARDQPIVAMCVVGENKRLIWLSPADAVHLPDAEERLRQFLDAWPKTLEILSR